MRWPGDAPAARIAVAAIGVFYAIVGLVLLKPEGLYSGDIGVKYVQARALAASHFTSLDLPYPGAYLDPAREFFPLRPPFVMTARGETQAIFSPTAAVLQAAPAAVAGIRGLTFVSVVSAIVILIGVAGLASTGTKTAAVVAVGVASPLWAYAVLGWEHAPAVALSTMAFVAAYGWPHRRRYLAAGLLLGAAALLRDEAMLLAPGLLLVTWLRDRSLRAAAVAVAGIVAMLGCGVALDVWWFGRPPAAHLRHAVELFAASGAAETTPGMPALERLSFRDRYGVIVQYWLIGYGKDPWIIGFVGSLLIALAVRWRVRSAAGALPLLAWTLAVVILAGLEAWDLVFAPKWLAGMHRVAPYVVFALLPAPRRGPSRDWLHPAVLATTAIYVVVAFIMTNTTGGKSLGPRLLLPLLPLLAVTAIGRIAEYLRAAARPERWIGAAGAALVVLAAVIHTAGTIPAYYQRNTDDSATVLAAQADRARVVIADDAFTAQLLFPLFYRKIVFLADTHEQRARLGERLLAAKVPEVLLISRRPQPGMRLSPLLLGSSDKVGRMYIQRWGRVGRELR